MMNPIIWEIHIWILYAGMSNYCKITNELPTICTAIRDVKMMHFFWSSKDIL
jgi:hypothetical protein